MWRECHEQNKLSLESGDDEDDSPTMKKFGSDGGSIYLFEEEAAEKEEKTILDVDENVVYSALCKVKTFFPTGAGRQR